MKNPLVVIMAVLVTGLVALFLALFLLPQSAPPAQESRVSTASTQATPRYADLTGGSAAPQASATQEPKATATSQISPSATPAGKQENLDVIWQAMSTFSEEGLPVLKPYLSNPDPEIRSAAVEAIKQLAVPAGAEVLRTAAKNAETTREQIEMLEAAEFLELPRLPVSVLKELMETGKLKLPTKSGQQTTDTPAAN